MSNTAAIATMMMVSADHLTLAERRRMVDEELTGCQVQDGASALALIQAAAPGDDTPSLDGTGYSPERWAIEQYAFGQGCTWVLWEAEGYVLDGFPTLSAPTMGEPA